MRTIAIVNQKGGCGKTTTAINLAGVFAQMEKRTLLVDLDPQAHCAAGLAIPEQRVDVQIGDALLAGPEKSIDWTRLLWRVSRNFDLAPSTVRLAGLEAARGGLSGVAGAERRLLGVLTRLADQYDICLIDCPPSIGMLTFNALMAAGEVLIPVETSFFALQGAGKQVSTIASLGRKLAVSPAVRLVPTIHDQNNPLAADVLSQLRERFGNKVLPVVVRRDDRLREAVSFGQPVIEYDRESAGAEDYSALARHLLEIDRPSRRTPQAPAAIIEPEPETDAEPGEVRVYRGAAEDLLAMRSSSNGNGLGVACRGGAGLPSKDGFGGMSRQVGEPEELAGVATAAGGDDPLDRASDLLARVQKLTVRAAELAEPLLRSGTTAPTASPPVDVRPILGARVTSRGVLFAQPLSAGSHVSIAGDFNNWSPTDHPLTRNEHLGVFERLVPLPPGRHQYRLVVDGQWVTDPYNQPEGSTDSGGAGGHSMIEVMSREAR